MQVSSDYIVETEGGYSRVCRDKIRVGPTCDYVLYTLWPVIQSIEHGLKLISTSILSEGS